MLTDAEKRRYKCHILLPELGEEGQEKIKAAKVLVIGAGGLGAPVLQYLTAAGVGTLAIIDDGTVDEGNLHRQILYGGHDLGKLKTIISKQRLNALNPFVTIEVFNIHLKPENALNFVSRYDIIVDATDNSSSSKLINDACIIANKPWVYGALSKYEGMVSSFNCLNSPSLRCFLNSSAEHSSIHPSQTGLLGVLPGITGSFQAVEVLKIITGIGTPLLGKMLVYNMITHLTKMILFEKDPLNFKSVEMQNSY